MKTRQQDNPATASQQPWNLFADFSRQQMAVASESAGILFRGFEAIRKLQEQIAHQAGLRHQAAAEKLKKAGTPNDVLEVQADLLRSDVEAATRYWQDLGAAAMELQTQMLGCATHLADTDALLETVSAIDHIESAVPGLEDMFTPKRNGAARRRRAS